MERVIRLSAVRSIPPDQLDQVKDMGDLAAISDYANGLASRQLAKALTGMRSGDFANASEWAERSIATSRMKTSPGWSHERERNRVAAALLIKAISLASLHRTNDAQAALKQAIEIIDTEFADDMSDFGREWQEALFARILRKECEELLRSP
jgi:hypothetical protein